MDLTVQCCPFVVPLVFFFSFFLVDDQLLLIQYCPQGQVRPGCTSCSIRIYQVTDELFYILTYWMDGWTKFVNCIWSMRFKYFPNLSMNRQMVV